jgi:hypothetical protein
MICKVAYSNKWFWISWMWEEEPQGGLDRELVGG